MTNALFTFGSDAMFFVMSFCGIGYAMGCRKGETSVENPLYYRSRIWMAVACFLLVAENLFIKFVLPAATMLDFQITSLFFTYIVSRTLAFGMSPSFDKNYLSRKRMTFILSRVAVVTVLLAVARFAPLSRDARVVLFFICLITFVIDTTCLIVYVIHSYVVTRKAYAEFYSEDYDRYLLWTPVMMTLLQLYALGWTPMLYAPLGVQAVYAFFGTIIWFYLFVCYERHSIYFRFRDGRGRQQDVLVHTPQPMSQTIEDHTYPIPAEAEMPIEEMEIRYGRFVSELNEWVRQKGYCEPDITIETLAHRFGTNRTYLSTFINSHYGMPFRTWIATLRIAEGKRLLTNTDMRENEIAQHLGFSSLQAFTRTFAQSEGIPPSAFRKQQ